QFNAVSVSSSDQKLTADNEWYEHVSNLYPEDIYQAQLDKRLGEHFCGDGTCNSDEDCITCPEDCGGCPICEDVNSDGFINVIDLAMVIFVQSRHQGDPYWHAYDHMDMTGDGMINFYDVSAIINNMGQVC
ncbi:MAG: hypothetical protein KKC05_00655, partial [Nanoarchaeota archaeon]|nr:hypothetical protein [Nanoarchaeota archaeon]